MRFVPLLILGLAGCTFGLVLHPNGEPPQTWTGHPSEAVAAAVGPCSGTVIHPHYVITASHFSVGLSTPIMVAGQVYYPEAIYTHPTRDLRLIKVLGGNFNEYAAVQDVKLDWENYETINTVIGGWGKRRGSTVFSDSNQYLPVGYLWGSNHGNLRWGTSKLSGYSTAGIYTKFKKISDPNGTPYECALATYDSGCGMYYQSGEDWQLIGIGRKVVDQGYSYYCDPTNADELYGTLNIYLRIEPFVGWIESILYGADITKDGWINSADLGHFYDEWLSSDSIYYYRSDFNRDGRVDLADFTQIASQWDTVTSPADITGNGDVDVEDLMVLIQQWLQTGSDLTCDLDNSGTVDIADFSLLAKYW